VQLVPPTAAAVVDEAVDGLVADSVAMAFISHATGDLLRGPAPLQAVLDVGGQVLVSGAPVPPITAGAGGTLSRFREVGPMLGCVPVQLPLHGGAMAPENPSDLGLRAILLEEAEEGDPLLK